MLAMNRAMLSCSGIVKRWFCLSRTVLSYFYWVTHSQASQMLDEKKTMYYSQKRCSMRPANMINRTKHHF